MNRTKVYRHAAWLVENHKERFSCNAVATAHEGWYPTSAIEHDYRLIFAPGSPFIKINGFHYDRFIRKIEKVTMVEEEQRDLRVLLLCMMAACWRDFV